MINFLKKNLIVVIIFVLGLSVSWPLMRSGYFSHQDDLQIIRIVEMRECFNDLQIPCRWVPDMGWGNGFPLFNFYGVSTYYIGALLSYFVGLIIASKLLFFFALTAGSFGVYLLVKSLWGKYAGLTSAVLYLFAPYKALDIYVRGALSESIALTIIPFVLYLFYKKNYKLFTLSLFLFLITHNIMTIVFLPVIVLWAFYCQYQDKFKDLKITLTSFVIAAGLSSFFILPAFLEKNLVQTESLTRFELDFRANFISLKQLFLDRVWGYGTSIPGPEGGMNFQIGWPHWILSVLSVILLFFTRLKKNSKLLVVSIFAVFLFSIFMTHNKSSFIWERFSILEFFQFPWRFLSLSILTSSLLGGFVVSYFSDKYRKYIAFLLVLVTVILNWSYFKPREFYQISDNEKITGENWEIQRRGAILDYLPKTALEPRESAASEPIIISGKVGSSLFDNRTNKWKYKVEVLEDAQFEVPVYYFPNWEIRVNNKPYPSNHDNLLGRISFNLPKGSYTVDGSLKNTSIRTIANILSVISLIGFIIVWRKK